MGRMRSVVGYFACLASYIECLCVLPLCPWLGACVLSLSMSAVCLLPPSPLCECCNECSRVCSNVCSAYSNLCFFGLSVWVG